MPATALFSGITNRILDPQTAKTRWPVEKFHFRSAKASSIASRLGSWLLSALPYNGPQKATLVLQDFDRISASNDSTSPLSFRKDIGRRQEPGGLGLA